MPANKSKLNNITQTLKKEVKKNKNETVNSHLKELTLEKDTHYFL